MKAREINKHLQNKMGDWLESLPDDLARRIKPDIIVTGGAIVSLLLKEKVNDYDVYFKHKSSLMAVIEHYGRELISEGYKVQALVTLPKTFKVEGYETDIMGKFEDPFGEGVQYVITFDSKMWKGLNVNNSHAHRSVSRVQTFIKSAGVAGSGETEDDEVSPEAFDHISIEQKEGAEAEEKAKYRPTYMTANAVSLTHKVQLVFRFFGDPEEIHKNYDFVHATNYWTFNSGLVCNVKALEATLARELIYVGSRYPLASIFRTRKFIRRGWSIHIGNYVKMAMQLNEMDLKDINVLREQLTGVDALYLSSIIRALSPSSDGEVSEAHTSYSVQTVCEICDRLIGGSDDPENEEGEVC